VLRYALISTPFAQPMNFTLDVLVQAASSIERIQSFYDRLRDAAQPGEPSADVVARVDELSAAFDAALDDNLNVSRALAALFAFVSEFNKRALSGADAQAVLTAFSAAELVFDTLDRDVKGGFLTLDDLEIEPTTEGESLAQMVRRHLAARAAARKEKDFSAADRIRRELEARGVQVEDVPGGVRWRYQPKYDKEQ
jgi:cysteinyl-tRNA synthetase